MDTDHVDKNQLETILNHGFQLNLCKTHKGYWGVVVRYESGKQAMPISTGGKNSPWEVIEDLYAQVINHEE